MTKTILYHDTFYIKLFSQFNLHCSFLTFNLYKETIKTNRRGLVVGIIIILLVNGPVYGGGRGGYPGCLIPEYF